MKICESQGERESEKTIKRTRTFLGGGEGGQFFGRSVGQTENNKND